MKITLSNSFCVVKHFPIEERTGIMSGMTTNHELAWVDLPTPDLHITLSHYLNTLHCGAQLQELPPYGPGAAQAAEAAAWNVGVRQYHYLTCDPIDVGTNPTHDPDGDVTPMPESMAGVFPSPGIPRPGWRAQWSIEEDEDLEEITTLLREAGARLAVSPTTVLAGMASIAILVDPFHCPIFLWKPHGPRVGGDPDRMLGVEHTSVDFEKARAWYDEHFPIVAEFSSIRRKAAPAWVPTFEVSDVVMSSERAENTGATWVDLDKTRFRDNSKVIRTQVAATICDPHGFIYRLEESL